MEECVGPVLSAVSGFHAPVEMHILKVRFALWPQMDEAQQNESIWNKQRLEGCHILCSVLFPKRASIQGEKYS